ncbi:MAG: DNA-3-methyladenine glycosylase [Gammaproteobacteria bacterium]|nr:DNA-3-methyladenine glycosylase [Gammaproteobacteria bacterium]
MEDSSNRARDGAGRCPDAFSVDRAFFCRDPREVARDLLGAMLVNGPVIGRIVETEAYLSEGDPAAHAYRGRTKRTEVLFGPPGYAYVFRTRQHCCLNVVAEEVDVPGCVLIRAVAPVAGIDVMRDRRRGLADTQLTNGPAKLCQAFDIDIRHYGVDLCDGAGLHLEEGQALDVSNVVTGPRVGVGAATIAPWRYYVASDPFVSRGRSGAG